MVLFTPTQMKNYMDGVAIQYDTIAAALDAAVAKATGVSDRISASSLANTDRETPFKMYDALNKMILATPAQAWFAGQYRMILLQWKNQISKTGPLVNGSIIDLDTYLTYYNGVTPYQALAPWEFALIYYWAYNAQLSPGNVYAPGGPVAAHTYTTAGGIVVTENTGFQLAHGAIVAGASTFVTDNGGVVPAANSISPYVQGYSAVIPELVVTVDFAGTGTVVLTFTGVNQAGVAKTWTATVVTGGVGLAAGTVLALTPLTGGDRMRSVSAVATGGTTTAGTWTLRVKQEAGRPA